MATADISQVPLEFYDNLKPVVARFDQSHASTEGGVVWLKARDECLQLPDQVAACLADRRTPDKIRHTVRDLLRRRILGLACGDKDATAAARLAHAPLPKLAVARDPVLGRRWPPSRPSRALKTQGSPGRSGAEGPAPGSNGDRASSASPQGAGPADHD